MRVTHLLALVTSDGLIGSGVEIDSKQGDAVQGAEILTAARVGTFGIQSFDHFHVALQRLTPRARHVPVGSKIEFFIVFFRGKRRQKSQ